MRDQTPYNAALHARPGNRNVKQLRYLAFVLALASPAANAVLQAGSPDEVRERLRPFGEVCRSGEACPGPQDGRPSSAGGENWTVIDPADAGGEEARAAAVQSRWASADIRWPETSASIRFSPGIGSTIRFTNLNLDDGETSRYGRWANHWITLEIGEREMDFRVRQPADGPGLLLLGTGPVNFLRKALEDQAGDTLGVRVTYRSAGPVSFSFPLAGAAESMQATGMIDRSVVEALASRTADGELAEEPRTEAPAPFHALTAAAGTRSGQAVYDTFCFACHATGVTEAPLFGSLEQWQPRIDKGLDELVATSLTGFNLMPPMGTCMNCTEDEMRDAIAYMVDNAR